MDLLQKLDEVEQLLKHMPGRHDQKKHAPLHGRGDVIPYKSYAVDRAAYDLVKAMNAAGLETTHSCSGHVCDNPLESEISFFARGREASVAEFTRFLPELQLEWELEDRPGRGHYSLHERRGFYGAGELPSSEETVSMAYDDLSAMASWWESRSVG